MNSTPRRRLIVISAISGVVLFGAAGFAAAATGGIHTEKLEHSNNSVVTANSVDDNVGHGADDATTTSNSAVTTVSVDPTVSAAPTVSVDDHGADGQGADDQGDDHGGDRPAGVSDDSATGSSVETHSHDMSDDDSATSNSIEDDANDDANDDAHDNDSTSSTVTSAPTITAAGANNAPVNTVDDHGSNSGRGGNGGSDD